MHTEKEVFEGETMQIFIYRNLLPGLKSNTAKSIMASKDAASERGRLHGGLVGRRNQPVPGKRGMKRDLRMKRAACVRCSQGGDIWKECTKSAGVSQLQGKGR